jgi:hypothetical protein
MRVVDLGGEAWTWREAPTRPADVVLVNPSWTGAINDQEVEGLTWARSVVGDACDPSLLVGERFDLVYSNSVIEHLGGHTRRIAFADTVHRLADCHWIQTPNKFFPIEPHYWAPGTQFLAPGPRAKVVRRWPIGTMQRAAGSTDWPETKAGMERYPLLTQNPEIKSVPEYHALRGVLSIELLSASELRFYFPTSSILRERVAGLTKSLIAAKG